MRWRVESFLREIMMSPLIVDVGNPGFDVIDHIIEFGECFTSFKSSIVIGVITLGIEIASVQCRVSKGISCSPESFPGGLVLIKQGAGAGTVQVDGGKGCHGISS
jgi:hypothetical protein